MYSCCRHQVSQWFCGSSPHASHDYLLVADMGHGAFDDTQQVLKLEQPSIETTKHLVSEMGSHDLLLHVGDLSYADGYEPIVSAKQGGYITTLFTTYGNTFSGMNTSIK